MIENLDMNICTESPLLKKCFSCKKEHDINHYLVAGDGLIMLCTECLEKISIRGLEKCGYKNLKNKALIKNKKKFNFWKGKEI